MQQDRPLRGPGRASVPGHLPSIRQECSEQGRAGAELVAGVGVMGTGIFLILELQGARFQSKISCPGMHTKKGCADAEQTSPRNAAPARARYSPVSPRSMAGVVGGTGHGRANNTRPKIREKKSKKNQNKSLEINRTVPAGELSLLVNINGLGAGPGAHLRAKGKLMEVLVEKLRGLSKGLLPAAGRKGEKSPRYPPRCDARGAAGCSFRGKRG